MADKQDGWLNAETAERLLRGESLDNAVEAVARDEAERLAKTLGALSVEPPVSSAELPGEAAALAAFRKARADRGAAAATPVPGPSAGRARSDRRGTAAAGADRTSSDDAGLVRIGGLGHRAPRPRRGRPVRLGLAAALAFGMAGSVAVAAGTGVLPTPFGDDEPGPHASVTAAVTPERPLSSPSPGTGVEGEPTPDGSASPGGPREDAGGAPGTDPGAGTDGKDRGLGSWWKGAPSACRDVRDGKQLSTDRRRALEGLAGGSTHVWQYCKGVLANADAGAQPGQDDRKGSGTEQDDNGNQGAGGGEDESHPGAPGGRGNGHRPDGGVSIPSPSPSAAAQLLPKRAATSPDPSPSPSYSAL